MRRFILSLAVLMAAVAAAPMSKARAAPVAFEAVPTAVTVDHFTPIVMSIQAPMPVEAVIQLPALAIESAPVFRWCSMAPAPGASADLLATVHAATAVTLTRPYSAPRGDLPVPTRT